MGYFDGLAASSFKTNEAGQVIFYPWGKMGKGYTLPTKEKEARIRKFVKLNYVVSLPVIFLAQIILGWQYSLVALLVLSVWYYLSAKKHLKGLLKTDEKLTVKESVASAAKAHNTVTLWIMLVCSVLFVLAGTFFLIFQEEGRVLAAISTIFFGAFSAIFAYTIKQKSE